MCTPAPHPSSDITGCLADSHTAHRSERRCHELCHKSPGDLAFYLVPTLLYFEVLNQVLEMSRFPFSICSPETGSAPSQGCRSVPATGRASIVCTFWLSKAFTGLCLLVSQSQPQKGDLVKAVCPVLTESCLSLDLQAPSSLASTSLEAGWSESECGPSQSWHCLVMRWWPPQCSQPSCTFPP